MRVPKRSPASRPSRTKPPPSRLTKSQQRERILRERVTYMLWVMANRVD